MASVSLPAWPFCNQLHLCAYRLDEHVDACRARAVSGFRCRNQSTALYHKCRPVSHPPPQFFMWGWEKGVTPGSVIRGLGPWGQSLVYKYVSGRFSHHGRGTPQDTQGAARTDRPCTGADWCRVEQHVKCTLLSSVSRNRATCYASISVLFWHTLSNELLSLRPGVTVPPRGVNPQGRASASARSRCSRSTSTP